MRESGNEYDGMVKEHSGWLVPLGLILITIGLAALVLAYYFAPGTSGLGEELPSPTDLPIRVALSTGNVKFRIPANYLPMASARNGGPREEIDVAAVLPNFDGFSLSAAGDFEANASDSPVVHVTLRRGTQPLAEADRFRRIYSAQVENEYGQEGPFGLREFAFRADTGYHAQDLFTGNNELGPAAILCDKPGAETPSPNCLRDYPLGNGLALSYRFKRARLEQWQEIDRRVRALLASFEDKS